MPLFRPYHEPTCFRTSLFFLFFFLLSLLSCSSPQSQPPTASPTHPLVQKSPFIASPPQTPILKLETGGHTEDISRLSLDAAHHFLVTGSKDKTVRVWDIKNKTLSKILRPPIGPGHEGKIFAVAISPDGDTIASGGYTGTTWDQAFSIYIFNRLTGQLTKKISDLPSSIGDLEFSPDGRLLLAGLHGRTGIHAYRVPDFTLIAKDESYYPTSHVYGLDFDSAGRFATSSYDGFIRLYEQDFHMISKAQPLAGKRPYGLSFSPDGNKIAVGFVDTPQVILLSGKDLSLLDSQPPVDESLTGTFTSVAWSHEGSYLYTAGTAREKGTHILRKWAYPNLQNFIDTPLTQNTVLDLVPLKTGGTGFSAAGGSFGLLDSENQLLFSHQTAIADFRDNHQGLLVSEDGSTIQFAYSQFGKYPAQFSIDTRVLSVPPIDGIPLYPPQQESHEIKVEKWLNTENPTINGKPFALENYEVARSVAIASDRQSVLLGTSWNLRLYDRKGKEVWQTAIPDNAWGVNISKDGQVAVAALGDGTIRWYRLKDGVELLVFFPHRDRERWVIWTPSGFYDAAPGSEQFIGWNKNYGPDYSADFFPIDRFRSISFRPQIIQKMLVTWDEKEASRLAEEEKPSSVVKLDTISDALIQEISKRQKQLEQTVNLAAERFQISADFEIMGQRPEPSVDQEKKELTEKVNELQLQLAEARQMAKEAEHTRQAQQKLLSQKQADLEEKLASLTKLGKKGETGEGEKIQELQRQLTEAQQMAEAAEQKMQATKEARQAREREFTKEHEALARLTAQAEKPNSTETSGSLETLFKDFPPEVIVFSPQDMVATSDPILSIHYTVITHPQAPVTDIAILIDGQPLSGTRGVQVLGNIPSGHSHQTIEIPLPQKNCTISLLAKHRWATSKPAIIQVQWDEKLAKPNLYVLAIGPGDYTKASLTIPTAAADAEIFTETLQRQSQRLYDRVESKILINDQASRDNILDGLDWLHQQTTQKDLAMLFFAGHLLTDKGGIPYLLTPQSDLEHLRRSSLPLSDITNAIISMAGKTLLFLDPCQSNTPPGSLGCMQGVNALSQNLANASNAVVAFVASSGTQRAIYDPSWSHSAFTTALIEGLNSQINASDSGIVSMNRLDLYLSERVKTLTHGHQRPTTIKPQTIQDFPLAMANTPDSNPSTPYPTVITKVTEIQPAQEILSRLPPIVTILSPTDHEMVNSSNLTIRYSLRNPSGEPVTDILALVDGRPIPKARGVQVLEGKQPLSGVQEFSLSIPKRDITVSLLAKNRWSTSEPASVRLRWNGADPQPTKKPRLNVLAVGISAYKDSTLTLDFAAKDARDFTEALRHQAGGLYEQVNVQLITEQEATKDRILGGLEWIDSHTSSQDLAMIFLAGHGVNDSGGIYYFLPVDADTSRLRRTALPYSDIKNTIAIMAGKTLLFVDSCHAGDVMGMRRGVADINALVNELTSAENGAVVFASSTGRQFALEDPAWGNGAFTKALLEGLQGEADFRKTGAITVNMLDLYLSERVKALTNGQQTPTTTKPQTIQDFPIAVATGEGKV